MKTKGLFLDCALCLAVGAGLLGAASCETAGSVAEPAAHSIGQGMPASAVATSDSTSAGSGGAAQALALPSRRLRRLSTREYNSVVHDLLGDTTQPANQFLVDSYPNGYDNGSAGLAVQSDQARTYEQAAEALAQAAVTSNMAALLGTCDPNLQGEPACLDAFLSGFASRAYRRPLTSTEAQRLRDLFTAIEQNGGAFTDGIEVVLETILQSPQFLYREELGSIDATGAAGSTVTLTDYEVASELSFLLTGSIPDDTLWGNVQAGNFKTVQDFQREATRLLTSPAGHAAIQGFLGQWLVTNEIPVLNKDPSFYPNFTASLGQSMSGEIDRFYDSVLWSGSGSLRELFSSNQSIVDGTLGLLYGLPPTVSDWHAVTLDPTNRLGIMSRAGFLAVHSDTDSSGPVTRGVFVLNSILCTPPPPPPANVPPAPPANDPTVQTLTTRQRFSQHSTNPVCAACHDQIDGIGFGFEEFDGIGAYRTSEHGQPIDASGTIIGTGEIDGDYVGLGPLATRVAGSHLLVDCFTRQAYRYAMGDVESDSDPMQVLEANLSPDTPMTDALMAIVTSPLFVQRTFETPAQ
jgi:hypothetical protein